MSGPLYIAVALCIGSPPPASPGASIMDGADIALCDRGVWAEGLLDSGLPMDKCREVLAQMHDRGNIAKMCVLLTDTAGKPLRVPPIDSFYVEWSKQEPPK